MVPEGLTNKTSFKKWSRRYKLVAGATDERPEALVDWAEARDMSAPTIIQQSTFETHVYARLLMNTGAGTEVHSIVHSTPSENGLEAWRRLVQRCST